MFPPSLHKNIRELGKQISLLESECENMESEERKKALGTRILFPKSKESVSYLKASAVKEEVERPFVTAPRFGNSNLFQKSSVVTPVTKLISKNSLVSKDIKKKPITSVEVSTVSGDEVDMYNKNNFLTCRNNRSNNEKNLLASKKDRKTRCIRSKELDENEGDLDLYESDVKRKESESENENQILHKGIVHANPGGTIEVTVTQKNTKPHNNALKSFNCKIPISNKDKSEKGNNSESLSVNKNSAVLSNKTVNKKKTRNQKWSEILCLESENFMNNKRGTKKLKNDASSNCSLSSKFTEQPDLKTEVLDGVITTKIKNASLDDYDEEIFKEFWNNENKVPDPLVLSARKKQRQTSPVKKKNLENAIDKSPEAKTYEEKEVQCIIKSDGPERPCKTMAPSDVMNFLYTLIDTLKNKLAGDENKCLLSELDNCLQIICGDKGDGAKILLDQGSPNDVSGLCDWENIGYVRKLQKSFWTTKKLYEDLIKERNQLSEDLAVKEQLLKNASGKEKEYLTEITDLRVSLEKEKIQAREKEDILKELNSLRDKFINEAKVSKALRKSHGKMQEQFHKCTLENDKLKTQIRMIMLESQKFCVLLAGKDAEIKRYREELQSFQRQITEQLAALKSNAATFEVEKAMEAIIQHSQAISQSDFESVVSDSQTENPAHKTFRHREMIHSSPTSSKSSALNTSWNHISSIHDHNTETESNSNEVENEMNAGSATNFENGDASSDISRRTEKNEPSFISCRSLDDLSRTGYISRSETGHGDEECSSPLKMKQKLRQDIEVLFRDIKAKCSQRIFSIPSDNFKLDPNLLNNSETSDFSEISGKH